MDQVYNNMLGTVQAMAERQTAKPAQSQEKDGFQKLMNQKQAAGENDKVNGKVDGKTEADAQGQLKDGQTVVTEDPQELEKQMALAAMAAAQNPAIAQLIQETPEVLSDPSWEDGLVPVGWEDQGDIRIVHWMQPEADAAQDLEAVNAEAAKWIEEQNAQTAETVVEAPVVNTDSETPEIQMASGETVGAETQDGEDIPQEGMAETPVFGEVEAAPVKVGEAPAQAETAQTEDIGSQIGARMVKVTSVTGEYGDQKITVYLEPENLGKVHVELSVDESGILHLTVNAENSQTQSLLSRNTESLAAILGRYAENTVQVEVPRQEESQQQNFYDGQQGHERQSRQQQQHRQEQRSGEDFLHQLRLGLIPGDGE